MRRTIYWTCWCRRCVSILVSSHPLKHTDNNMLTTKHRTMQLNLRKKMIYDIVTFTSTLKLKFKFELKLSTGIIEEGNSFLHFYLWSASSSLLSFLGSRNLTPQDGGGGESSCGSGPESESVSSPSPSSLPGLPNQTRKLF